ncbi:MAG: polyketide synthase dehydratase domain-containing protein, partial [Candidatus Margulisbacteria bacterium]|nr:polyketide synthase dehydratase domain-containing protein [Candidatus Margulisiibacteriota bacterium]
WLKGFVSESLPTTKESIHPLLDENRSTFDEVVFVKTLSKDDFYIQDHVVDGKHIFPGSAHIEMAVAAGKLAIQKNHHVSSIHHLMWLQPVIVKDERKEIAIHLKKLETGIQFEIRSVEENPVLFSKGELIIEEIENKTQSIKAIDTVAQVNIIQQEKVHNE